MSEPRTKPNTHRDAASVVSSVSLDDDATIVARVLAGETQAYRVLVERYQRAIHSCAYQVLHNAGDAEEAAQEAFVQAFEKLSKLREPRYFFSWTWRICATVALKGRLKAKRAALGLADDAKAAAPLEDELEREERRLEILAALAELPDEQREAVTLRFWEGMEYDDMARLLGVTHDALYQRISRALKTLKEKLGEEWE